MTTQQTRIALLSALVGLGASIAATYVHYHLLYDPRYVSFCDMSATVSCTQVYSSRFSVFMGVPVSIYGAIWFALGLLLTLGGMVGPQNARESVPGYLFVLSTVALAVILYLAYLSFVVIKAVCVLCLLTYAAVIGLFVVSGAAVTFPITSLPKRAFRDLRVLAGSPLALLVMLGFFAGAASTLAFFPREATTALEAGKTPVATQDQRSEFDRWYASQPRVPLAIPADGAKVLVVKFNDYQCPACGQSYKNYKSVFSKFDSEQPGAVKLVLKDFPLNPDCNPGLARMIHSAACEAAVAVRLARQHNRADALEEWLYTHQEGMTGPAVRQAAKDIGQVTDFDAKYNQTIALVKSDVALGNQLRVNSTPTFFINGVKVDGTLPRQYFEQAIDYELQHASK